MGIKLDGKPVVKFLREDLKKRSAQLTEQGTPPTLLILRVGEREDDISYERGILKGCEAVGIKAVSKPLPIDLEQAALVGEIEKANTDPNIHGIMLFRPLPPHLDCDAVSAVIAPEKDVDSMSPANLEKVFEGKSCGFVPCTPKAVMELLAFYEIPLKGANVVVAGRSLVVGKPLAMLLLDENATVTIAHSRTRDLRALTKSADLVVAAVGKAKLMDETYFTEDSIVIDVGINDDGNGKICGDVDYARTIDNVKALTPAIGGIGTITTTILLSHVVQACEHLTGK